MRAFPDFLFTRNTISATRVFAGKASADRREIDLAACHLFVPSERGLKPSEQRSAGSPGEGAPELRLFDSGSLSDQEDTTGDRSADHHRFLHAGESRAESQGAKMSAERVHAQPKSSEAIRYAMKAIARAMITATANTTTSSAIRKTQSETVEARAPAE